MKQINLTASLAMIIGLCVCLNPSQAAPLTIRISNQAEDAPSSAYLLIKDSEPVMIINQIAVEVHVADGFNKDIYVDGRQSDVATSSGRIMGRNNDVNGGGNNNGYNGNNGNQGNSNQNNVTGNNNNNNNNNNQNSNAGTGNSSNGNTNY